jgi:hypothetical protein
MLKTCSVKFFSVSILCASLAACGGGGSTPVTTVATGGAGGTSGAGQSSATAPVAIPNAATATLTNSQAIADQLTDFAIAQAKQVSSDIKGISTASSSGLPLASGGSDGVQTKSVAAEKAINVIDYSSLCNLYKSQFVAAGISACSGQITTDTSFTGNSAPSGGYAQLTFTNMSITTVTPAETIGLSGGFRMDFLSQTTLQPLTGKVKLTTTNLVTSSSSDASPQTPQNILFTATFANGAITSYEDTAKSYSVASLATAKDATGIVISTAALRSLFNGAHVDTLLKNVKVNDKLASVKVQTPFVATITGSNGTSAEVNLSSTSATSAVGTVKITDASGVKTYNVSRAP